VKGTRIYLEHPTPFILTLVHVYEIFAFLLFSSLTLFLSYCVCLLSNCSCRNFLLNTKKIILTQRMMTKNPQMFRRRISLFSIRNPFFNRRKLFFIKLNILLLAYETLTKPIFSRQHLLFRRQVKDVLFFADTLYIHKANSVWIKIISGGSKLI